MNHAFYELISRGELPATGAGLYQPNGAAATQGYMLGWGTTPGNSIQGWAPGAQYWDLDAAAGSRVLINEGSNTAAVWALDNLADAANTWALLQTFTSGLTSAALGTFTLGIVETNLSKIRIATQTVTDSTTLVPDNTLIATLVAGATYIFDINYNFTTINSSGVKLDLNGGTATMTAFQGNALLWDSDATTPALFATGAMAFTTLNPTFGVTACGLAVQARMWGGFVCNAAGTFIPQFAQNAETGAAESVIAAIGSSMKLTRCA